MKIAIYLRVSTHDQSTDMQRYALEDYANKKGWQVLTVYEDLGVSGANKSRQGLNKLMTDVREGLYDLVLVYRFDRFGRSTKHLIDSLEEFKSLGVEFCSMQEGIDTSTPVGKVLFTMIGAFAEFERSIISERIKSGLANAKSNGKMPGPKTKYNLEVISMYKEGFTQREIAQRLELSLGKVQREIKKFKLIC